MRKLLITRGAPASGKTTFLRQQGLLDHTLSADAVRDLLGGPVIGTDGEWVRPQDQSKRAWAFVYQLLEERMRRGEFVAVDGIHARGRDLKPYQDLAKRYGYETLLVDFANTPKTTAVKRNRARHGTIDHVPEQVVVDAHDRVAKGVRVPEGMRTVWGDQIEANVAGFLREPVIDLSGYRRVHHLGDLQGSYSVLTDPRSPIAEGIRDDEFYIFVGDMFDRGVENGRVAEMIAQLNAYDNVVFLGGNHEDHLERFFRGEKAVSAEFDQRTLPQLREANIGWDDLRTFLNKLQDVVMYRHGDQNVMVTHAGLSTVPERPELVSTHQYRNGTGFFTSPVDDQFEANAPEGWVQVHGHRNSHGEPVQATPHSFNLEDDVEHGGCFRAVTLDSDGWHPVEIPNRVFRPMRERGQFRNAPLRAPWIERPDDGRTHLGDEEVATLRSHDYVKERTFDTHPHISSFSFKQKAFYKGVWDEVTQRARGLYMNRETGEVVARGYDKFFNIGEREETDLEALKNGGFSFPVQTFVKENGFLGLIGYDPVRDGLFISSKTNPESDFAVWMRDLVDAELSARTQEMLRRWLRDSESCLVLEVNDPERDPHMIAYERPHLVLLDVLRRSPDFERLPYFEKPDKQTPKRESVESWARSLGVMPKEPGPTLQTPQHLQRWLDQVNRYDHVHAYRDGRRTPVEGYVLEDANGYLTKAKLPYYSFWKFARSIKDRVRKIRGTSDNLKRDTSDPAIRDFYEWCLDQPEETLAQDIISVRRAYLAERPDPTSFWQGRPEEAELEKPGLSREEAVGWHLTRASMTRL